MRLYLDASLLVAALTHEAESTRVQTWLATQTTGDLAISDWVLTEFSSALSIKLRAGTLSSENRAQSLATFTRLATKSFESLPISRAHFRTAALFADRSELGLRAGDALHLAIAHAHGATVITLDRLMVTAAAALGVSARLP